MTTKTLSEVVAAFVEVHGGRYDYSHIAYAGAKVKVKILCRDHGIFEQTPNNHLSGFGCPSCGRLRTVDAKRKTTRSFISEAKRIHGNSYSYKHTEYIGNHTKVTITCPAHGNFLQEPAAHLIGKGCPKCAVVDRADQRTLNTQDFIRKARATHGTLYSYKNTRYTGMLRKLTITCRTHGDFQQTASNHCRGAGCPVCASYGFDQSKPAVFYVIDAGDFIGYGITNNYKQRMRHHTGTLARAGYDILASHAFRFVNGSDALALETRIKCKKRAHVRVEIAGFKTEALDRKFLPKLIQCAIGART